MSVVFVSADDGRCSLVVERVRGSVIQDE